MSNHIFFCESRFNVPLKGIVDINGTISDPFKLVIAMEPRNPPFDDDHTRYSNYIALHVDREDASFSMKMNGVEKDLTELTEIVNNETNIGLEPGVMATYWLSYDRDNRTIKYGKGYAMVETTLLVIKFLPHGIENADIRREFSKFFGIQRGGRDDVSLLLYGTEADAERAGEGEVEEGMEIF